MSRSIRVGDYVEVFLPPDSVMYKIVDIGQDGWIYLYTENTSSTDGMFFQGIITTLNGELKILGSEDMPYRFEFIPGEEEGREENKEEENLDFENLVGGLTGDQNVDFQITKNLDYQIVKDMTRSESSYIRNLAYKGLIYQDYGEFVEKYGIEHDFKEAYDLISLFKIYRSKSTYKATNPIFWGFVATYEVPDSSLYINEGTPESLDVMIQQGIKVTDRDLQEIVRKNNLLLVKWALDRGYKFTKTDFNLAVYNGFLPMVMLLIKYGYEPNSENLHTALCYRMFNMAQIFLDLGVKPDEESIGCLLRDGEIEWAEFIINEFDLVPSKNTVENLLLRSSGAPHQCEGLKITMKYIHLYPEFGPESSLKDSVISLVIDAECPELFEQILELGYVPSEHGDWRSTGISDVFLKGNVDMASSLVKRGYRPSDETLMQIRDLAFNKQYFYPNIDHRIFGTPSKEKDFRERYRTIYDMLI